MWLLHAFGCWHCKQHTVSPSETCIISGFVRVHAIENNAPSLRRRHLIIICLMQNLAMERRLGKISDDLIIVKRGSELVNRGSEASGSGKAKKRPGSNEASGASQQQPKETKKKRR